VPPRVEAAGGAEIGGSAANALMPAFTLSKSRDWRSEVAKSGWREAIRGPKLAWEAIRDLRNGIPLSKPWDIWRGVICCAGTGVAGTGIAVAPST
jgi:hypothetical protein